MLGRVVGDCWHALVRDVLALGYRKEDIFTTLDLGDMLAIAIAAPPNSSVRFYLDGGWSRTDHLLANMQEGQAGLANLAQAYERPGVDDRTGESKLFRGESMGWEEFDELQLKREEHTRAAERSGIKFRQGVRKI